ncbi:ABC transporter transmembrane domain-containing protein [Phycisphaerales bacterium AB-hyl4]|uniref:ABC transporter transmembrane domain-containing protein n=1 Tax=Natronomicrosphaera hydrolytica TaxID=3242702 RepID=A0ABV4U4Z6_9BACT
MSSQRTAGGPSSRGDHTFARLAALLKPYWAPLVIALAMLIGLTVANIAQPQLIAVILDRVFPDQNFGLLWVVLFSFLSLYAIRNYLYFRSKYTAVKVGENVCFTLRNQLFERLQQMNLRYYQQSKPGQLSSRVMNDSFVIQEFIQSEVPKLLTAVLLFLGVVAVIYATNWQLALASTIVLPMHLIAFHYFKRPIKSASRSAQEHLANAHGNLIEKFLGIEVVKGFTGEQRESQAFQEAIDLSRQSQLQSQKYHVLQKVAVDLLIGLGYVLLFGFGAYQVIVRESLNVGQFAAFFIYVKMLEPTVTELMGGFAKLTKASACMDRVFELLDSPGGEGQSAGDSRPEIQGNIRYENVSFRYDDGPRVLEDISFEVQAGQVCAIVGPSGAGKSTMVSLVPRFNEQGEGTIYIDGKPTNEIHLQHLREAIGVAFQECFLFNSSVLENLRYARPGATRAQIIDVATRVGAHEFITKLPQGYDTMLGESGVNLSRGQKQQLALTRAMLKDPQILILDEATASIDTARESQIVPSILEFMQGKTTLMITHRPELLKHADVVLYVNEGRLVSIEHRDPANAEAGADATPQIEDDLIDLDSPEEGADRPADRGDAREHTSSGTWGALASLAIVGLLGVTVALSGGPAWADDENADDADAVEQSQEAPHDDQATEANDAEVEVEADAVVAPPQAELNDLVDIDVPWGRFLAKPGLSAVQVRELIEVLVTQLRLELGYEQAPRDTANRLPPAPDSLSGLVHLRRMDDAGGEHLLQLGYRSFMSRPTHVWLYGERHADDAVARNTDVQTMATMLERATDEAANLPAEDMPRLRVGELRSRIVHLSYVESDRAVAVLKSMGYEAIEFRRDGNDNQTVGRARIIEPTQRVDPEKLPIIIAMPGSDGTDMVGGRDGNAPDLPHTSAGAMMELLVLYHPAEPEQFTEVANLIRDNIDRPARQILIEAMVLEVSETGLRQLGIDWTMMSDRPFTGQHTDNIQELRLGRLPEFPTGGPSLELEITRALGHFTTRIEALIRDGEAEVLSRPSVLTLDNRQASISVGEEIPIAQSIRGRTGDHVELSFDQVEVGIFLNVRPRVTAEADEVSMQITGTVSAQVPGQDLVVRDSTGQVLGSFPRISKRQVQTYSRIANNTPFIIGGLISTDDTVEQHKVPLLGDLPLLGALFRSERRESLKREVIIVITPYVLPENQIVGRNLPKDEDFFDSTGHRLFRDAYRIRGEDVFDLSFIVENRELRRMQRQAERAVRNNHQLRERYPFDRFIEGRFPGEHVLVYRQMYEVGNRRGLDAQIDDNKVIFFRPDEHSESGFRVTFLDAYLRQTARELWAERDRSPARNESADDLFDALGDNALAITFTTRDDTNDAGELLRQPVPELQVMHCPDRRAWSRLLWELNQPDADGRDRHTILLQTPRDLRRVRQAIALKQTADLNATSDNVRLRDFTIGRQLLLPDIKDDDIFVMDDEVAKYFFYTEMYYPVLQRELQRGLRTLEQALEDPRFERPRR